MERVKLNHLELLECFTLQYGLECTQPLETSTHAAACLIVYRLHERAKVLALRIVEKKTRALSGQDHFTLWSMSNLAKRFQPFCSTQNIHMLCSYLIVELYCYDQQTYEPGGQKGLPRMCQHRRSGSLSRILKFVEHLTLI